MMWFAFASCSALLSAAAAVLQKKTLFQLTALEFSFFVSVAILFLSSFIPVTVDVGSLPTKTLLFILGKSVLGCGAFFLVMLSLKNNQISSALPLLGLTPAVTALLSLVLVGENMKSAEWAGIILMLAGTYVLEIRSGQTLLQPLAHAFGSRSRLFIIGALCLFAISSLADKMLVSGYRIDPLVLLFYQHSVYAIIFAAFLFSTRKPLGEMSRRARPYLPLIFLVALITLAYRFAQLEATKGAPVALVLAVKRTSILFASLYGGRLFSEERLAVKLIGALLIVGGGLLILRNVA